MNVDSLLADGASALAGGEWAQARTAFEAVLASEPRPEALDGLGEALWWLGDPRRSNELREQAYAGFRRAGESARAALTALGVAITYEANFGNNQAAMGWVARAGRLVSGEADPLAAWVCGTKAYLTADVPTAITLYRQSLAAARALGDVDLELSCLSGLGERLVMSGDVEAGMALIDEAMAGTLGGEYTRMDTVVYTSCDMLIACDIAHDLERAARWVEVANRFIDSYGCPFLHARCRTIYGGLLVHTGRWSDAERELSAAIDLSTGAGPHVAADAFARMADLRLRQGRIEDASSLLLGHEDQTRALLAAAAVRLARGDPGGAVTVLQRRLAQSSNHIGSAPALELLVRASLRLGQVERARDAAGALAVLAADRRSTYTEALAAAAAGHLSLALNDIDEGCARLEAALHHFVALGMPYDAARARLEIARALASSQPEVATAEAASAFATFEGIGARSDADSAAALLRSLGAPPASTRHRSGELTDREQQVLRLIALGLSNPEIAARLHISRKTAAHHVSNVLTKLGARNRTEAAAHLPAQSRLHP